MLDAGQLEPASVPHPVELGHTLQSLLLPTLSQSTLHHFTILHAHHITSCLFTLLPATLETLTQLRSPARLAPLRRSQCPALWLCPPGINARFCSIKLLQQSVSSLTLIVLGLTLLVAWRSAHFLTLKLCDREGCPCLASAVLSEECTDCWSLFERCAGFDGQNRQLAKRPILHKHNSNRITSQSAHQVIRRDTPQQQAHFKSSTPPLERLDAQSKWPKVEQKE